MAEAGADRNNVCSINESVKDKRYDRQLRLWDNHGQHALESAHVCLINATATGTEILKSLVLPGIGAFTILDSKLVTEEDAGNNFFVDVENIGKSRAECATKHLLELNPDVRGDFVDESVECILQSEPKYFEKYSVVIATNVAEKTLLNLAEVLFDYDIPLLVCRSYGMIGYMRIQFSEHTVIESHPENEFHDLRLDKPFTALKEYVASIDLESLGDTEHAHIPFVVLLMKCLDSWKSEHDGKMPQSMKEKILLKEQIMSSARKDEENFKEACQSINRSLVETKVPSDIMNILNDSAVDNLTNDSKAFWVLVKALKEFVDNEGNGCLPVRGIIPDMTSDTNNYIKLQGIYKSKANEDIKIIYSTVQQILFDLGKPQNFITENDVKMFCKNAHCLRVVHGRSLKEEYDVSTCKVRNLISNLEDDDGDIVFYVLFRAVERFHQEHYRYPGANDDQLELDIPVLKNCVNALLQEYGCAPLLRDDYVHEMCRSGAGEFHSVAAFIGGCAAHEVIKLITRQYVPFNNTIIYNAISQNVATYYL